MRNIKFYEVSREYIEYLLEVEPHLFRNKKPEQMNERKYIGIVLCVNGMDYFAPLSSYKDKHQKMAESVDFIKVKRYAVINLNNMFPVPKNECTYVDINQQKDIKYKSLLLAEYRVIKTIQDKIRKNAVVVYQHKMMWVSKVLLTPMIYGFLRVSRFRNPETLAIRSFFCEKWLLSRVSWGPKSCFSMQACNA